jgi:molybdate transport system substrate-binding protein
MTDKSPSPPNAADIKVLSTHAVLEVLRELASQFERTTGHRLSFRYNPANVIKRQIESGAAFDVAIVTRQTIDDLVTQGRIIADSCRDIARCGLGVAVRKGAPRPDIGTIEAFRRTMLSANSVVRSTDGTSGLYFEKLLVRLGIAEEMRDKIRLGPSGRVAELVARGEADMAVQQISELLAVTGADFVGPFPPRLQLYTVFTAGVGTEAADRDAALAFIDFLTMPAAVPLFKTKGLEPTIR